MISASNTDTKDSPMNDNWNAITGLVGEIKRCEEYGVTTAAIAMSYICIDTLASLGRPQDKAAATRSDFKNWVDKYLKCHEEQPYQYRGKDVYAARCAFLHTYGSEAALHQQDADTIKFGYHNGGRHEFSPDISQSLAIIGTASFINDVVLAIHAFLEGCKADHALRARVEERLPGVLNTMPFPCYDS